MLGWPAQTVVSSKRYHNSFALDHDFIYWIAEDSLGADDANDKQYVKRGPKRGGASTTVGSYYYYDKSGEPNWYSYITLDGEYIYLSDHLTNRIARIPKNGGVLSVMLQTGLNTISNMAVDNEFLFFRGYHDWIVGRVPLAGGSAVALVADAGYDGWGDSDIAIDDDNVYFVGEGSFNSEGVLSVPKVGGPVSHLTSKVVADQIAVDDTHVYSTGWDASETVGIIRIPKGGGNLETLFTYPTPHTPLDMAIDETHVYWTAFSSEWNERERTTSYRGTVNKMPKMGGEIVELYSAIKHHPTGGAPGWKIAVDDTCVYWSAVYWSAEEGQTIMRVHK